MSVIQFCKRCLYGTSHPLGLTIDDDGLCSGCLVHEEKDTLDWNKRWNLLEKIVKPYRSIAKNNYDCIVPVTGSQDSYYIVHLVKEKLGLNPLLVNYNKYFNTPLGIQNLANLRIRFNCDIIFQNINPISVKKITKSTLRQFGSIYWPILAGQSVFPVQTAVRYSIPLIIWGAHQGLEQVGMFSHEHEVEMTRRYRKDHDLMGYEADDLISIFDTLKEEDIWQYRYPDDYDLNCIGVRGIYLGNYVRWDPKIQHEKMIRDFEYNTSKFLRTFDCYDYVDCFNYMNIHDQLKLYKHGYSKVTDHACREIRHGRLTRNNGLELVKKYEQLSPNYIQNFLDWLGISEESLQFIIDRFRNSKFWVQKEFKQWEFNGWSKQQDMNIVEINTKCKLEEMFINNNTLECGMQSKYITVGKGWSK
jgi:N-acetyl sugar amidotransferase